MRTALLWLPLLLSSCGGDAFEAPFGFDAGPAADGGFVSDAGLDAGHDDAGAADAGPVLNTAPPFVGSANSWTYHEVEGATCGNGSVMPVLVNLRPNATRIAVYFQGGGACWDAATCFVLDAATHIDETLTEPTLRGEVSPLDAFLFNRDPSIGPFANATFVYVPYCTGDLYAGANVSTYATLSGPREVHHVGAMNTQLIFDRLQATVPAPERVTLGGASAGGYGATLNFWRARGRWPGVRVDVLNDSGTTVDIVPNRWADVNAAWNPVSPPGCTGCEQGLSAVLPFYAATVTEPHRLAVLSFQRDSVISLYFGLTLEQFSTRYDALRTQMERSSDQRSFTIDDTGHVISSNPARTSGSGLSAGEWIRRFSSDDPAWATEEP